VTDTENGRALAMVHGLRELVVQLNLLGSEFARTHGLHATDVRALIALLDASRAGTVATPGWLGQQLGLNSASTTALVDRLEKDGLVARERDAQDRRRVRLQVTESAEQLGWSFFGPLIGRAVGVLDSFSPEELATIDEFLSKMRAVVENVRVTGAGTEPGS